MVDSDMWQLYMKPPAYEEPKAPCKGFVVWYASWTANSSKKPPAMRSSEEFPRFEAQGPPPKTLPWVPK